MPRWCALMICRRKYSASIAIGIASLLFIFLISLNTWEKLGLPNSLHKTYEARAELLTLLAAGCVVLAFITDRYSDKYHSKPALILTGTVGFAAALHFLTATDYFILALVLLPMFAAGIMITSPLPCPKSSEDRLTWVFCIIGLLGLSLLSLTTKPKPRWDVHVRGVESWSGSPAAGRWPLIARRCGSGFLPPLSGWPDQRGSCRPAPAP